MDNPFKPNIIVYDEDFIGREAELVDLETRIKHSSSERILLIAPRRFGKTSLLKNLIKTLKKENRICIYMDIFNCSSLEDFANTLMEAVIRSQAYKTTDSIIHWIKTNLLSFRANIKFQTNLQGELSIEPEFFKTEKSAFQKIREVFSDIESLGKTKPVLLIIDEFQTILEWDKDQKLEKDLRSITQELQNINIIFSGSQVRLLREIFDTPQRAFYKQTTRFYLGKISRNSFSKWIKKSFKKTKTEINQEVIEMILDLTKLNPQQIQLICHELWNVVQRPTTKKQKSKIDIDLLNQIIESLVKKRQVDFENLWMQLTKIEKTFLKALAQESEYSNLYSKTFSRKYNLSTSSIQKLIPRLENSYLITYDDTYYITDLILAQWLNRF